MSISVLSSNMTEPGTKKRRMESPIRKDGEGIVDEKAEIETLITLMKVSTQNLKPVLADDLVGELPTVNVFVGTVIERKSIYKIIVSLTSLLPLTQLQHLKRARNTEILICPSDGENIDAVIASLQDKGFDLKTHLQDDFKIVAVASKPPQLKWQHEKAHKIWPCNFHPNKYTEMLTSGEFFSKTEVERHRKYMALTYEVAEVYEGTKDRSDEVLKNVKADGNIIERSPEKDELIFVKDGNLCPLKSIRKELSELKGVLIVDPEIDSIVAVGYDRRTINPCQHPVMIAIDNVARSQFGGAWNDNSMFAEEIPEERTSSHDELLVKEGVPKMFRNILNTSHADLRFGAKRSIRRGEIPNETANSQSEFGKYKDENATTVKGDNFKLSETIKDVNVSGKQDSDTCDEDMEQRKSFGSSMSISSQSVSLSDDSGPSKPSGPYLCTGYDVYTTNEPCIMCSMALVHSRARRVMFALKNEENGALTSTKLHTIQALNHRYEVFTGFFEEHLS